MLVYSRRRMTDILFEDAFELLDSVRTFPLKRGESLISYSTLYGDSIGFAVADTQGPATRFMIKKEDLRRSCRSRTSAEAQVVLDRMTPFIDRYLLGKELRSGAFSLEEKPAPELSVESPPVVALEPVSVFDVEALLTEPGVLVEVLDETPEEEEDFFSTCFGA